MNIENGEITEFSEIGMAWKSDILMKYELFRDEYTLPYSMIKRPGNRPSKRPLYVRSRRENNVQAQPPDEYMTAGNRDRAMWKTALKMSSSGRSFDEYFMKLCSLQVSSRDWTSWDHSRREKEAIRVWDNAGRHIAGTGFTSFVPGDAFVSNLKYYDQYFNSVSSSYLRSMSCAFINPYRESRYGKVRERGARDTFILIKEMIGKMIFDVLYPRTVTLNHRPFDLLAGFQFPRNFIELAGKYHGFKSDPRKIAEAILNTPDFIFSQVNSRYGKYSHREGISFCRQWNAFGHGPQVAGVNTFVSQMQSGIYDLYNRRPRIMIGNEVFVTDDIRSILDQFIGHPNNQYTRSAMAASVSNAVSSNGYVYSPNLHNAPQSTGYTISPMNDTGTYTITYTYTPTLPQQERGSAQGQGDVLPASDRRNVRDTDIYLPSFRGRFPAATSAPRRVQQRGSPRR